MTCPIVSTTLGKIKGVAIPKANHEEAKQVFAYFGIPFAKPPLGNLRFKAPEKPEPWDGVLDASKGPPAPMASKAVASALDDYISYPVLENEDTERMSEDCLYLNVYTNNPDMSADLPVLFWLYGGGFNFGSAVGYNGQALCGLNDVVLVVPQYRVNVFGFYNLGKESPDCNGNMGLWDQIMAMRWVKYNIRSFGGNPNNVTIFGESAGASSVSLHVMSPESRGLFHRAISHSGVLTFPREMMSSEAQCKSLHEKLNITATDPEDILKQLREIDAEKLIEVIDANCHSVYFTPIVDGKVIPKHPIELIKDANFAPVPYIIGFNNSEGYGIVAYGMPETFAQGLDKETCVSELKKNLSMGFPPDKLEEVTDSVLETLNKEYKDEDQFKWSKILGSIFADTTMVAPSIDQAMAHSGAGHTTYVYYMTQQLKMYHEEEYSGKLKKKPSFCEADHGDDLIFTMGHPFLNCKFTLEGLKFSDDEKLLSKQWMKTLCNFAKTGNPNSDCSNVVQWPKYDCENKRHLVMKMPYAEGSDLLAGPCKLWLETVPQILKLK